MLKKANRRLFALRHYRRSAVPAKDIDGLDHLMLPNPVHSRIHFCSIFQLTNLVIKRVTVGSEWCSCRHLPWFVRNGGVEVSGISMLHN